MRGRGKGRGRVRVRVCHSCALSADHSALGHANLVGVRARARARVMVRARVRARARGRVANQESLFARLCASRHCASS